MKDEFKKFVMNHKRDFAIALGSSVIAAVIAAKLTEHQYANAIDYRVANDLIAKAYHPTMGDWLLEENSGKIMQLVKS